MSVYMLYNVVTHQAATKGVQPLYCFIMVYNSIHPIHEQHDLAQSCNTMQTHTFRANLTDATFFAIQVPITTKDQKVGSSPARPRLHSAGYTDLY